MAKHNASTVSQTPSSVTSLAAMASSIVAPMIAGTSASPALQNISSSEAKYNGLRSSRNIVVSNARPSGYVVDMGFISVSSDSVLVLAFCGLLLCGDLLEPGSSGGGVTMGRRRCLVCVTAEQGLWSYGPKSGADQPS